MSKKNTSKKEKKESFFQKFLNLVLTIIFACLISSQVCTAANNNLRFAQISDSHFSTFEENTSYKFLKKSAEILDDVVFQLNTSGPYDFVIFTGDLVNKPIESELTKFISHAKKIKSPWYAINGNHDIAIDGPLTKKRFRQILNENNKNMNSDKIYYAFTPKRGYRVLCLDSIIDTRLTSNGEYSEEEMAWLKEELDNHTDDVIIICTHVPINEPYSSPNHRLNNEYEVKKLLRSYKNTIVVLQGHYHCTRINQQDNVVYISCPSLVTYPNAYRVVNINSNKKRVKIDIFLKETNLKDIQSRSKMRLFGTESLYGDESDRNATIEILKNKE
ncbi:MAG: metallophosphoesterase [bacterium]|nr:metallophosphoesterase [bacterium]